MDSVQVHMYIHYYIDYYINYVYSCVQDLQYSDIKESRINTDSDENKDEVWWLTAHHSEPAGRTCWSGCSCWHAAVLQRRPEARSCRWLYLPVRILNGGPGHHLWSQHPHRQCWRPLVQPLSRHPHLHGAFKRVITAVIQSNYEPSQHTESVSLMFRKIYIRMTSSCSDVMLRSGAPHQALFLELGRLSSDFCVWKQHGRHREVAAQSVSASPASEWNDSTTGRHKVSNHVSASTQQLVDWNVPTLRLDGGFRLSQQHTNAPWTFCGSRWNCMQSD